MFSDIATIPWLTAVATIGPLLACIILGTAIGLGTGLLPGLHVNTLAPLLLGTALLLDAPAIGAWLLLAVATAHTIVNIIPTIAAPIPEDDTALVLLPVQRLAKQGYATDALRISVRASCQGGALTVVLFAGIILLLVRDPLAIPPSLATFVLVGVLALLILPHPRAGYAALLFTLAAVVGLLLLDLSLPGPIGGDGTILMPIFAGLFGAPMLVMTLAEPDHGATTANAMTRSPSTRPSETPVPSRLSTIIGTSCGVLVSLFPGLTSATAGAVGRAMHPPRHDADDVAMLSAVNTANVVGNTGMLLLYGATRSGASLATGRLLPTSLGIGASTTAAAFLACTLGAILLAAYASVRLGPPLVRRLRQLPAKCVAAGALALLAAIVVATTGALGILVTTALIPIGLLPHRWKVPRALLMGCLLGPYLTSRLFGL